MSLNTAMKGDRVQITLFGRRNAGKSSVINAITGQDMAIVSDVKGTTTDPVSKAMEILPIGPCMLTDTPGLDDEGELGEQRIERTLRVLEYTDLALLVVDITDLEAWEKNRQGAGLPQKEEEILGMVSERKIPCVVVLNQMDKMAADTAEAIRGRVSFRHPDCSVVTTSAISKSGIDELKQCMAAMLPKADADLHLVGDLVSVGDIVVLVVPIDSAAPKGRLIMPQQQVIRDLLDHRAVAVVSQVSELESVLETLGEKVHMVVTDSQAFGAVAKVVPDEVPLTSFSILFARHKGNLQSLVEGVTALERLRDGDKVLIAEGCTHHRQCDDIGSVKIPRWLKEFTGKDILFETCSGMSFPADLSQYAMVIHCGGCTLHEREMKHRIYSAARQKIPIVNYGIFIAYVHGILKRSVELFPSVHRLL